MISNAAHLSSWLGETVSLPVDEDLYLSELQKRIATSADKKEVTVQSGEVDMSGTFNSKG